MFESELFSLLEHTTDAAFAIACDGAIQYWNKAAERMFGFRAEEELHKTCFEVLHGTGPPGTEVCHEGCSILECSGRSTEVPNFDMNARTRSGRQLWINMSTIVFDNARTGKRLLIHLAHGISGQKKAEQLAHKMLGLSRQLADIGESTSRVEPVTPLSDQEKQILRLFVDGRNSADISAALDISVQTLRNHLHHINQKLRTHKRLQAVMNAIQGKLI